MGSGKFSGLVLLAALLFSAYAFGQQAKLKDLKPSDYSRWSTLNAGELSNNSQWASYSVSYESGNDTLAVVKTDGAATHTFPGGHNGSFMASKWFVCLNSQNQMILQNLEANSKEKVDNVSEYQLSDDRKFLFYMVRDTSGNGSLFVMDVQGNVRSLADKVGAYKYCAAAGAVAYICDSPSGPQICIYTLTGHRNSIAVTGGLYDKYASLTWQQDGNSLLFLRHNEKIATKGTTAIGYYGHKNGELKWFLPEKYSSFPTDREICSSSFASLSISPDGKRVFFGMEKKPKTLPPSQVQVWNTSDKDLYPVKALSSGWDNANKVGIWWLEEDRFMQLSDNTMPQIMFNGTQSHAITYNINANQPQSNREAPIDYTIIDLSTGKKEVLLRNQPGSGSLTIASPGGRYISYFKKGHWWCYDIAKAKHYNITENISEAFYDEENSWPEEAQPYGNPGWIEGDAYIILYDRYDVWLVKPDGSSFRRITDGRKGGVRYRIVPQNEWNGPKMNYNGAAFTGVYHMREALLFKAEKSGGTGYSLWKENTGVMELIPIKNHRSQPILGQDGKTLLFLEEDYNIPPVLTYKVNGQAPKALFRSNPQHNDFKWGYSELITYEANGKKLQGALFYPAGYDPSKRYPMVVNIYELQSELVHQYVNPSEYNIVGFNISNLTTQGYFVLLPDIVYRIGNPGLSALECVEAATRAALAKVPVNPKRVGLTGHSFGGYQTDFIVTHTDIFATAVAGAAVTDFINGYFYVNWYSNLPSYWRYEYGQMRMGKTPFEDYRSYLENSPLYHADKVNVPLLTWTGEKDFQVHYYQSLEFHMALRRLNKKSTLLIYPEEGHALVRESHQQHLTRSMEQWFGHYLKGEGKPEWIE